MAKAIIDIDKQVPNQAEEEAQSIQQILKAASTHRESLLAFMDVLDELHKMGILEAVQAMLKNKKQIALVGLGQLNKPGAHRLIKKRDGSRTIFLTTLDPAKLQTILNGVSAGVEQAVEKDPNKKKAGIMGYGQKLARTEVLSSMSMLTNFF